LHVSLSFLEFLDLTIELLSALSSVLLDLEAKLAAALVLEAVILETKSPVSSDVIIDLAGFEAGDGASLVAAGINAELFENITVGLVDGGNSLAVLNDNLAKGVLVGVLDTVDDILGAALNSGSGLLAKLLEDAED
jgi:hypothetical protein